VSPFLQRLLSGALSLSIAAIPVLLCAPMLSRRYRQKTLYGIMLILTAAYLVMPFRPTLPASVVVLPAPEIVTVAPEAAADPLPTHTQASDVLARTNTNEQTSSDGDISVLTVSPSTQERVYTHPAAVPMSLILPPKSTPAFTSAQFLSLLYMLGAATFCTVHIARLIRFARLVRRWQGDRLLGCYQVILDEECARLGVRKAPSMYLCEAVSSPMLYGLLRPRILLPDESLNDRELRLVLRHELIHLKRWDVPLKLLSLVSLCLNWFNPLCHILHRQLEYYCETSCDEQVLHDASWTDVERYTTAILSSLRRSARCRSALSTHFSGGKKRMKNRILTMMDAGKKRLGALVCALVIILTASSATLFTFGYAEDATPDAAPAYLAPEELYVHSDSYQALVTAMNATETGEGTLPAPIIAYTHNPLDFAIPACNGPTSWSMPDGQYLPGVPVKIIGYIHTAGAIQGYTEDSGMFYAEAKLLGDEDLYCYIPLVFLSLDKPDAPDCTITLKTDDPTGFVSVFTDRSADSIPVNAYQAGTALQLIGRQCGWYHVQVGATTGYVKEENATLSPEAEKLFDNQLFRFEGFFDQDLLGDQKKLDIYNRLIEQAFQTYGDEKSRWTMEQRAWYSRLTLDYNQIAEGMDVNVLPTEDDLTCEEALQKTLDIIVENGDARPDLDWYDITWALFYNYGDDPANVQWRVSLWPIDRRLSRYAISLDKQGECIRYYEDEAKSEEKIMKTWSSLYDFDLYFYVHPDATLDDMPTEMQEAYKQYHLAVAPEQTDLSAAAIAQEQYGLNNYFWPLSVRMEVFGGENTLPREGEMTLEEATDKALKALVAELGQEALDALGDYKTGAILQRIDEGLETEFTRWMIFVTDDPDVMLNGYRMVFVDKGSDRLGDGVEIKTVNDTSNG